MSYDEEQQRRSRVVVETPTARREVVETQRVRVPERSGYSTGVVAAVALAAIAVTALLFLFLTNRGEDETTNTNIRVATAPTPLPTQPTPIIIQQAPPPPPVTTQPAPVVITPPVTSSAPVASTLPPTAPAPAPTNPNDDATVQANLGRKFLDDAELASTDVTATVLSGKALLTGTVNSAELKRRAERVARTVKGVRGVENKIVVRGDGGTGTEPPE